MQKRTLLILPLLQYLSIKVRPKCGLEQVENETWKIVNNNPQFVLKHPLLRLLSGWVSIRIEMHADRLMRPKIYYDLGDGFYESQSVFMRAIDEHVYQADILLEKAPRCFHFNPDETCGTFQLKSIIFRVHSKWFYRVGCLFSIIKYDFVTQRDFGAILRKSHVRYRKHGISGMLERLEKDCRKLYPYKLHRETPQHAAYLQWIINHESVLEHYDENDYVYAPLISVIVPTHNTHKEYLKEMIESVLSQTYPHWELCIADDASTSKEIREILNDYEKKYENIKVLFVKERRNISETLNSALSLATGEYVVSLYHHDKLAPHALLEIVKKINEKPYLKLIYSDEDKIDEKGRRYDPYFKSGWNPDMFFSQNYISHLTCIQKEIIQKVGGFRKGYEGSQDYDMVLRCLPFISENEIDRIEKILYHWRALRGSVAAYESKENSYTHIAGKKALQDYFFHINTAISIEDGMLPNTCKVVYPLPKELPLVSILIPTRDGYNILHKCIGSILEKTLYSNYEIIVLDNETTCPKTLNYFKKIQKYPNIKVLAYHQPFNYSAINNFGVAHAKGEIIALVNNDVEIISKHWLTEMVRHAIREDIGAVGAMLYYDDNTIQHAGVILGLGGVAGHSHKKRRRGDNGYFKRLKIVQNYSAVTGACLVVKKALYNEVGGMEEDLAVAFNDVDFCLKLIEKGYRNLWTPYVELYHHESVSRGGEDNKEKIRRFESEIRYMKVRWHTFIKADPSYNRNLTYNNERFEIGD